MSDVCYIGIVAGYHGWSIDERYVQNKVDDCYESLWREEEPTKLEWGHEHDDRCECEDCCTRS